MILKKTSCCFVFQMKTHGFGHFVGIDGSKGMLEMARESGLYQDLKECMMGEEPLPVQRGSSLFVLLSQGFLLNVNQHFVMNILYICCYSLP